ncbi:MAG: aminomethyl-transferring glycine dehydrogenase [Candidatus Competibacteraceae bacterium]|nr:aminomethyl-transferring glycine dehydrogenase [Candidatus Competibacteraceae bacterium]
MTQSRPTLAQLEQTDDFIGRHIGPAAADRQAMLESLNLSSLEELVERVVPRSILETRPLDLEEGRSEQQVLAELKTLAGRNKVYKSLIGMGYHGCHLPPVILRNVLENPGWYTAYTPYQPEISQGRLEALLNFQTMVMDLTGMELANASLLDEATAAAEAMGLCRRISRAKTDTFLVAADCHPQTLAVLGTRAEPMGIQVQVVAPEQLEGREAFGVLLQYPGSTGRLDPQLPELVARLRQQGVMVTVAADLLALTLLTPPGEFGADVVVGSTQRFGVPPGFGGPHAAYFATKEVHKRAVPGRLVGVTIDSEGRTAYRLALQTREQHIRREKATSNICTAQVLLAVIAGFYAAYHGPRGLITIARRVHRLTAILAEGLKSLGHRVEPEHFFDTLTVATGERTEGILGSARDRGINLRRVDDTTVGISLDETVTRREILALWEAFAEGDIDLAVEELDARVADGLPVQLRRRSDFLTHPAFNRYHSETEMLRYLRRLMDRDIALDRAMIPLGSCTMKLNATTEMLPITWEGFAAIHPFVPPEQAQGYRELIRDLESWLAAITGFAAVSLQPNSGAQGEYAGLLVIRAYHRSRNEAHRNVCLIPSSAHGTNPASAQMAGMKVVVVKCDKAGNVDVADLRAQAEKHRDNLAALMVTYPSTHGVFEEAIREICEIVHANGGQIYMDGANLNALVGLCKPGQFGADVSHMNLHKTFCIPHGGGGPGVGPIGVAAHLAPFLPAHPFIGTDSGRIGPVAAAPWGSAGILAITWAYIRLMGRNGLPEASKTAILNANYIARRLEDHYPVLYTGPHGMVAHECIIDLRPIKERCGISVEDVAKRLIDYGFHAPTMSFPVAGTLMIEPTESESRQELDRFIEAMIAIRQEIRAVEEGRMDGEDNPLRNAPHTAASLAGEWRHPYSREQAVYPVARLRIDKYWPPVARADNVYGDRHLVCACPPMSEYQQA